MIFLLGLLGSALGAIITWLTKKAVQRGIIFTLFVVALGLMVNTLYSVITQGVGQFGNVAPVFSIFYDALMPANFSVAISVFITSETALAVFKWKFKLLKTKFYSGSK